ncbi:SpoIVB peptidase S55 domain-containing protein [Thermodesulfitimonas sp.]
MKEAIRRAGQEGRPVVLQVNRRGRLLRFEVRPRLCRRAGCYRIGLLIRDSTAGVGTLTFYHPETKIYGALGHVVMDATTAHPVELAKGSLVEAFNPGCASGAKGQTRRKNRGYQ